MTYCFKSYLCKVIISSRLPSRARQHPKDRDDRRASARRRRQGPKRINQLKERTLKMKKSIIMAAIMAAFCFSTVNAQSNVQKKENCKMQCDKKKHECKNHGKCADATTAATKEHKGTCKGACKGDNKGTCKGTCHKDGKMKADCKNKNVKTKSKASNCCTKEAKQAK